MPLRKKPGRAALYSWAFHHLRLLPFPTYKSASSGVYRFLLLFSFEFTDHLKKPPRIRVLCGENSVHSVLSEFLTVLKIHLNLNLDGKCIGKHSVMAMSAGSETRLPGFKSSSSCFYGPGNLAKSLKCTRPWFPNLKHSLIGLQ